MAKIIGYQQIKEKQYKGICSKCGAIIVFNNSELKDTYSRNEYCYSSGICPNCGKEVLLYKDMGEYEGNN